MPDLFPSAARREVDLTGCNTFGLPCRAAALVDVCDEAGLAALVATPHWARWPLLVLGGGSNIVLGPRFEGLVLKIAMRGRQLLAEDDEAWYVQAGAGERWHDFVRWTVQQGWPGLENLSLIPGTVGAAPVQNIGAYGVELERCLHRVDAVSLQDGRACSFDRRACALAYRDSLFKRADGRHWLITRVTFRLPKRWQPQLGYAELAAALDAQGLSAPTPLQVSDAVIAIRQRKLPDPARLGNAGSFFKNPVVDAGTLAELLGRHPGMPHYPLSAPAGGAKLAAGWLIERCGWKGRDLGPVGCYERQALVLVNRGGATGEDVRRLAEAVRADVLARFGVALEPEPLFV